MTENAFTFTQKKADPLIWGILGIHFPEYVIENEISNDNQADACTTDRQYQSWISHRKSTRRVPFCGVV